MAKTGAARVFFDIVGRLQSTRLLADSKAAMTVQQAIIIDAMGAVQDAFTDMSNFLAGAVNQVVESFFEFEQQLVRVRKFYGETGDVEAFANAAREMGLSFAFAGGEALEAAARTAQLKGVLKSQQAIIEATRQGLLLSQIGDMETEMGMNRFIALAQQTQFMYGGLTKAQYEALEAEEQANIVRESSIHTLNQLNTIENSSVATMEDITFVLNQFASQADIAGESIGDMAAMSALLLETGEEVSRAGTGLRMIYQRLGNANNAATKAIAELIPNLDAQGVAQLKLSDVIEKLAPAYANMTAEEKRSLAVNIAGSRHYIKFLKIMENQTRLTELQSAAFRGQYGALDEFSKKSESAVFQAQQMEAALENMRAKVGEDLTGAYMEAYRAEERFLKMVGYATKNESIQGLIGSTMFLSGTYDKIVRPISDSVFQVANLVIGMKTLNAVTGVNDQKMKERIRTYNEAILVDRLKIGFEKQLVSTGTHRVALMNREQQSLITLAGLNRKYESSVLKTDLANKKASEQKLRNYTAELAAIGSAKKHAKARAILAKQIIKEDATLTQLTETYRNQRRVVAQAVADMKKEQVIMQITTAQKKGRIAMEKRSMDSIFKQVETQKSLNELLGTQSRLMQQEVVLYQALDAKVKQNLVTKNADLAMRQREQQDIMAALFLQEAEAISKNRTTQEIREKIVVAQQNIQKMAEERMAIQSLIGADEVYRSNIKASTVQKKTFTVASKEMISSLRQEGVALKIANQALMATTIILPMVVGEGDKMSAMMYGVTLMMLVNLVPAISAGASALVTFTGGVYLATFALGALAIGIGALVLYAGFKIFDHLLGDKFDSDLDKIQTLNDSLNDTTAILSDLAGAAGDAPIHETLFGETTFNDLKKNADLTDTALASITDRMAVLNSEIASAQAVGDTELIAGLSLQKTKLEDIESQVLAIDHAQMMVAKSKAPSTLLDSYANVYEAAAEGFKGSLSDRSALVKLGVDNKQWVVTGRKGGLAFNESFGQGAKGKAAAEAFVLDFESQIGSISELSQSQMTAYYENLLRVQQVTGDEMVSQEKQIYNSLTEQQYEFANSREELFFGQRQNFTGSIYKQVVQGGVESLLHKTEIVQTNVFNGYNTEQMVDRVTKGVLDELRAQRSDIL
jgi:TP901 family phage tail tape measure protein